MRRLLRTSSVLMILGVCLVGLFQNCGPVGKGFQTEELTSVIATEPLQLTVKQCSFNGQVLASGQSAEAFQASSVAFGSACAKETRTCDDGMLSGSFEYASCTPGAPRACLFNGVTVAHGTGVTASKASSVAFGQTCEAETRACTDGTLSGSFQFASCSVAAAASCLFDGKTVAHGSSVTASQTSTVSFGNTCQSQSRTCNNGTLSGSYQFATCSVGAAAACLFDGRTVAHGSSVTASRFSTVAFGGACESQTRTCNNGTLSGSFQFASCVVGAAAACTFDGKTVLHGNEITAMRESSVAFGATCTSEKRVCSNGTLSGTFTHPNCTVASAPALRNRWTKISNSTSGRGADLIVSNGNEMWLTVANVLLKYDYTSAAWSNSQLTNMYSSTAPLGEQYRWGAGAALVGSEIMIWGGNSFDSYHTGPTVKTAHPQQLAFLNPITKTYRYGSVVNAPGLTGLPSVHWMGSQAIVYMGALQAGVPAGPTAGGIYDPQQDRWVADIPRNGDGGRLKQASVWTGSKLLIFGGVGVESRGQPGTVTSAKWDHSKRYALSYDPATREWETINSAPTDLNKPCVATWTGAQAIILCTAGKRNPTDPPARNYGYIYTPSTDTWTTMNMTGLTELPNADPSSGMVPENNPNAFFWVRDRVHFVGADGTYTFD